MNCVLVVDDDPGSRDAIALVLALEGFAVETAGSEADAIALAGRMRPAAVVCDLDLGAGGDGCAVARAIRADAGLAGTRLVALSGSDSAGARTRALAAGFDAYLLKPATAVELLAQLAAAPGE